MTKLAIVGAVLFLTGVAMAVNAEERPKKFVHQITEDVQIVLTPDQCNANNVQRDGLLMPRTEKATELQDVGFMA